MTMINHDRAVIGLFALILHKRMFIIDDMEFVGKKQSLTNAFLTLDQIKFAHLFPPFLSTYTLHQTHRGFPATATCRNGQSG